MPTVYTLIEGHEKYERFVYDDATGKRVVPGYTLVGHPTVGIGLALDTYGVTRDWAEDILHDLVTEGIADLSDLLGDAFEDAAEARRAALLDMRFTLGPGGFRRFHQMVNCVLAGQWLAAAEAALDSAWARTQAPARAQEDARLLRTGAWN